MLRRVSNDRSVPGQLRSNTMKRIREFIILSLTVLVTLSFFAEYAVTASAPGIFEQVELASTGRDGGGYSSSSRPVVGVWPELPRATVPSVDIIQNPVFVSDGIDAPVIEVAQ